MIISKEEKVSLTYPQLEILLRYLFKSTQIVHRLEQTDRELYSQLCEDTMLLSYVSIKDVHDFVKHLAKEIGLDLVTIYNVTVNRAKTVDISIR